MRPIIAFTFYLFSLSGFSQSESIELIGWVKDEATKLSLEGASVRIMNPMDSTLEGHYFTEANGEFSAKISLSLLKVTLLVDYLGYYQYVQEITMTDSIPLTLSPILLTQDDNLLDLIIIQAEAPPIINKLDTIIFNADSFKNQHIESTTDLLKELPGIAINIDGVMEVNGIPVDKVMINGKTFFRDDFLLALEDLPAELLKSIQVTSTKTKSEAFANEKGDQNAKTINLVIKDEKYGNLLGNVTAGAGTNERFELKGGINSFKNKMQFNILSGGNNTNGSNFSNGKISQNGNIGTMQRHGINFSSELGQNIDINGNYFTTINKQENARVATRENFLPGSSFFSNTAASSKVQSMAHSINLGFDIEISPTLLISLMPSLSIQKNENETYDSLISYQKIGQTISGSNGFSQTNQIGQKLGNRLSITKKTNNSKENILRIDLHNELNNSKSKRKNLLGTYFQTDSGFYNLSQDQTNKLARNSSRNRVEASYKFRLTKQLFFVTVGMSYLNKIENEKNSLYNKKEELLIFNPLQSTDFRTNTHDLKPEIKLAFRKKNWSTNLIVNQFYNALDYNDFERPELSFKRSYNSLGLSYQIQCQINLKTALNSSYRLTNRIPSMMQMQPFTNTLDPLNIIQGNPDLKLQENHQFNINLQSFDSEKNRSIFAHVNMAFMNNQVVQTSMYDENLIKTSTFTNAKNGTYSIIGNIRYDKQLKMDSSLTFKFNVSLSPRVNKNIILNNGFTNSNYIMSLIPKVNSKIILANNNALNVGYQVFYTRTLYTYETQVNQNLFRHQIQLTTDFHLFENCTWYNQLLFTNSDNLNTTFQQSNSLWNTSLHYKFFDGKADLSIMIYDLLNKNVSVTQVSTAEYIEDSERIVLERYALLKLTWAFKSTVK